MKRGEHRHDKEDAIMCRHQSCRATFTMDVMCDVVVGHGHDEELCDGPAPPHHLAFMHMYHGYARRPGIGAGNTINDMKGRR